MAPVQDCKAALFASQPLKEDGRLFPQGLDTDDDDDASLYWLLFSSIYFTTFTIT